MNAEWTAFNQIADERPAAQRLAEADRALARVTRQYHAAIDVTEETKRVGNWAWYKSALAHEQEVALQYAAAVRAQHTAIQAHRELTR